MHKTPKLIDIGKGAPGFKRQCGGPAVVLPGTKGLPLLGKTRQPYVAAAPAYTPAVPYTHDSRYQCAPGEPVYGAGFAARLPGIDPETGRPWVAREGYRAATEKQEPAAA